jgi:hypothetical protein
VRSGKAVADSARVAAKRIQRPEPDREGVPDNPDWVKKLPKEMLDPSRMKQAVARFFFHDEVRGEMFFDSEYETSPRSSTKGMLKMGGHWSPYGGGRSSGANDAIYTTLRPGTVVRLNLTNPYGRGAVNRAETTIRVTKVVPPVGNDWGEIHYDEVMPRPRRKEA